MYICVHKLKVVNYLKNFQGPQPYGPECTEAILSLRWAYDIFKSPFWERSSDLLEEIFEDQKVRNFLCSTRDSRNEKVIEYLLSI